MSLIKSLLYEVVIEDVYCNNNNINRDFYLRLKFLIIKDIKSRNLFYNRLIIIVNLIFK